MFHVRIILYGYIFDPQIYHHAIMSFPMFELSVFFMSVLEMQSEDEWTFRTIQENYRKCNKYLLRI